MSTDTDNELQMWAEMADDALAEWTQLRADIAMLKVIRSANAEMWELIDRYAEGPPPRATSSVPSARTESRSERAGGKTITIRGKTINIRWVPLPLSDLAHVALNDSTLTGNAREWSTPYLQALTTHEEGQTHYGADTVESLIAYALSGMAHWQGESAETVKAMFESYLPACQREG